MKRVYVLLVILCFLLLFGCDTTKKQAIIGDNLMETIVYKREKQVVRFSVPLITENEFENIELVDMQGENFDLFPISFQYTSREYNGYHINWLFIEYNVSYYVGFEDVCVEIDSLDLMIDKVFFNYDFGKITILEDFAEISNDDFQFNSQAVGAPTFSMFSFSFYVANDIEIISITNTLGKSLTNSDDYCIFYTIRELIEFIIEAEGFDDKKSYEFDIAIQYKKSGITKMQNGFSSFKSRPDTCMENYIDSLG